MSFASLRLRKRYLVRGDYSIVVCVELYVSRSRWNDLCSVFLQNGWWTVVQACFETQLLHILRRNAERTRSEPRIVLVDH